jgi:muconate cycloisomerase
MKIDRIEAIPLRIPFLDSFTIATEFEKSRSSIDVLIVKIHTDEGLFGIGETQAWRRHGSSEILENLVFTTKSIFEPLLIGKSPLNINAIMHLCNTAVYNSLYVQAAIGDALYDLKGKALGVPVHQLLGGSVREKIQVGICVPIFEDRGIMLEKAQKFYDKGYRHIRIKIGINPKEDEENSKAFRNYFGNKISLRADANSGMDYPNALRLLKKLESYDFEMIEQLIPLWDLKGLANLAKHTTIPLSVDESVSNTHSLIDVAFSGAASIVQTKTGKNGGIFYTQKLWEIANAVGLNIFPGNHPTTSVGCAAVTHLAAAWPYPLMVGDYQNALDELLVSDIVQEPLQIKDSYITVPTSPGLGMNLDEDKINFYRIDK